LSRLSSVALSTSVRLFTRKTVTFFTHDARTLLDLLRSSIGMDPERGIYWGAARGVPLGLAAADLFVSETHKQAPVLEIVEKLSEGISDLTPSDTVTAFEIADLFIIAEAGHDSSNPARVKAAVDLTFRVLIAYFAGHAADESKLEDLRVLFDAALDQNVAT